MVLRSADSRTRPAVRGCNTTWCASWRGSSRYGRALRSHRGRPDTPQEAARRRLDSGAVAGGRVARSRRREMTFADIDALVIGKAPDAFEGIVQPELFLADALG